jgi:hypothetical protein
LNQGAFEFPDRRHHLGNQVRPGVSYANATSSDSDVDSVAAPVMVPKGVNPVPQVNKSLIMIGKYYEYFKYTCKRNYNSP